MKKTVIMLALAGISSQVVAQDTVDSLLKKTEPKVIEWRRDFHQNPELGNRETRTAGIVAAHLKSLGMEVETGIAYTGS